MTWVWDGVAVYGLFRQVWIPGQARNDVGVGLVVEVYGLFRPGLDSGASPE